MTNINASLLMKNGHTITVNFTEKALTEVLNDFRDFDPLAKDAGTQTIRVSNPAGKLIAVIRCDEVAAITT
jgi:hypothetical protein